jgi:probable phosphoglycerate mutase
MTTTLAARSAPRLILVRHGEIEANVSRVWHGSTDSPLTERGVRQAECAARYLRETSSDAVALYSSPQRRALDTAAPIASALGLEPRIEPGVAEYSIGELEGTPYAELMRPEGFFDRIREDPGYAPPGGESPRAVAERVLRAFASIARAHGDARVILVAHGAALALGLALLLEGDAQAWIRFHKSNCGVSELELTDPPALLAFDRKDHLAGV